METVKLIIDRKPVEVPKGTTILDAAKGMGIRIPTLCYMKLEDLHYENNPGACRICVVEIEGRRNLAPSCKTECMEGMVVQTHSPRVMNARKTVMELITQSDKTLDALGVLDSLIREMPLKPERVEAIKQMLANRINNDYPPFRNLSEKVASARMEGFDRDPAEEFLRDIATMDMQDISRFYQEQISGRPVVYVIAGNRKRIDMNKLAEYGTIVKVKKKDIYK